MRLDHVSYVASHDELVDVVQRFGYSLGASFIDGGMHPSFGTRNFVLPLKNDMYIEIVCPLDHPATDKMPFGRAVTRRANIGGGWMTWVCSTKDIAPVEKRLGREAMEGHRRRPDGFDLKWKQIGLIEFIENPTRPFFIQWISEMNEHPSRAASSDLYISKIEIAADPGDINQYLGESNGHPLEEVEVEWLTPTQDEVGLVAVHVTTPNGTVRLD